MVFGNSTLVGLSGKKAFSFQKIFWIIKPKNVEELIMLNVQVESNTESDDRWIVLLSFNKN